MNLRRSLILLLGLLLLAPACGNKVIRPFKKKPGQRQERTENPPPAEQPPAQPTPPPEPEPQPSDPPSAPPPGGKGEANGETGLVALTPLPPSSVPAAKPGGEWYEWSAPTLDFRPGATDLGSIFRTGPAGKHGFLTVRGEDFVFQDGTPFLVWGTNLARGAPAPTKEEAPKIAAQLQRLGYNAVRLHLIDSAQLLFQNTDSVTEFNTKLLDRMDYLIAELKKRGIYYNINLYVWRRYGKNDNVPAAREIPEKGRYVNYFHPDVWKVEKEYTRRLLTHKNPYTGLSYAEDPAMCMVELSNENSLFPGWASGYLDPGAPDRRGIPAPYLQWLDRDFNRWLKTRYRSTAELKQAWSRGAGKGRTGLTGQESLEKGTVQRLPGKKFKQYSLGRVEDMARYLYHLETAYIDDYRDFLRKELKVKVPILNTQNYGSLPALMAQAHADWVDTHAYFDHPQFKGGKRSQPLMKVHERPWVSNPILEDQPGPGGHVSLLTETTMSRVAGKPYTITEWSPSKANPFAYQVPQLFGAYNAFHDVNGLFHFAYASEKEDYAPHEMSNHLQWSNVHPMLAINAVAALAWRRGDVAPAKDRIELHYSEEEIFDVSRAADRTLFWWGKDVPSTAPFHAPIARVLNSKGKDSGPLQYLRQPDTKLYRSSTGELTWDARQKATAHVVIDTPRYQGVVGSLQKPAEAAQVAVRGQGDAALTVISLDNQPLARTGHALLTAVSEFRFTGEKITRSGEYQEWDQGRMPLQVRAVQAEVRLKGWSRAGDLTCYALDGRGGRAAEVPVRVQGGEAVIDLQRYRYGWFELVAE
jgi:hypothetical protein